MKWIIRINSSDGPRYYGPFANAGAANAWIKALEREAIIRARGPCFRC